MEFRVPYDRLKEMGEMGSASEYGGNPDPAADNPAVAYRVNFYRLDGTVQLWRSRFLHVFLDLEYRETGPWMAPDPASPESIFDVQPDDALIPYTVFALKQNRQVRSGRMQYFDTPQFGVLVLVTAIAPEAQPEPAFSP